MTGLYRLRSVLQRVAIVLMVAGCTQSQPVRNPYYSPDPYFDPYYGGGYSVAYPAWRSDVDIQVEKTRNSIENGIEKGTLTRPEAQQLRGELNTLIHNVERMQRDGHLNQSERERIRNDLDRLQGNIRREKEDDERRRRR